MKYINSNAAANDSIAASVPKIGLTILSAITGTVHIFYLVFFFRNGITFMGIFNIFSVLFYLGCCFYNAFGNNPGRSVVATFVEIVTHAILATLFVGWNYGFEIILICMIPLPYMFMPKRKIYMHLLSLWTIALFIALRICCVDVGLRISENVTDEPSSLWYIFNCSLSFTVILMLTFIFRSRTDNLNQSLSEQNVRLKKVASVDSLTGLLNRRAMSGYLEQIAMTADYYSVALLDIDFFKRVNDTYGHAAGDEVLLKVSHLLLKNVPTEGYICRWGGEEILIVLPGFTIAQSREIAEDLRKKISEIRFESGGTEFGITVTIGVYECKNTDSETVDTAIRIADDRLYSGKNSGRNRVVSD